MNLSVGATILCVLVVALLSETAYIRPSDWHLSRYRRLSDQRLAELETILGLRNVKGVAVPVAFGKIDPAIVGRKRRSVLESILDQPNRNRPLPWKEEPRDEQRLSIDLIQKLGVPRE
ncbi:uncharacterized protein LOC126852302 [Cataglyphis hispanica]|uniref:uncharacterized protein LOC126852302 n=1 Tax=Cataglyphis hispanica TaxID=1086592 RepID=UPI0021800788|nr:uncharacterized protein LOC126852302 [Cataglyphis hispanica]